MARTHQRLTAVSIGKGMAAGYHADGGGLYLQVSTAGGKSWIFRYSLAGKRREMGLGAFPTVGLADARQQATDARRLLGQGVDPIETRNAVRARQRLEEARGITFGQAAEQFIAAHEGTWRNPKHRAQWRSTLAAYVLPKIGTLSVAAIGRPELTRILDPIWARKPETAFRVRGRVERILDWSTGRGYRTGENPARWRGHLDAVYPPRSKVRKVKHHAAVPIDAMPAVYAQLCEQEGIAALAARFVILTAARAGEVTGAVRLEFSKPDVWAIPGERMKGHRSHAVPLSREAKTVLKLAHEYQTDDRIFPGRRAGRPLSHTALMKALRTAGAGDATTHGTRSTFKDWASERTGFPDEVSEAALAHASSDKTRTAYARSDLLRKRVALAEAWANFLTAPAGGKVVQLAKRGR